MKNKLYTPKNYQIITFVYIVIEKIRRTNKTTTFITKLILLKHIDFNWLAIQNLNDCIRKKYKLKD